MKSERNASLKESAMLYQWMFQSDTKSYYFIFGYSFIVLFSSLGHHMYFASIGPAADPFNPCELCRIFFFSWIWVAWFIFCVPVMYVLYVQSREIELCGFIKSSKTCVYVIDARNCQLVENGFQSIFIFRIISIMLAQLKYYYHVRMRMWQERGNIFNLTNTVWQMLTIKLEQPWDIPSKCTRFYVYIRFMCVCARALEWQRAQTVHICILDMLVLRMHLTCYLLNLWFWIVCGLLRRRLLCGFLLFW